MPLYEYKCENCGEVFEKIEKFSDTPLSTHEKCGGPVHRLLSAPALQFKGSGWYVNDYAKGGTSVSQNGSDNKSENKLEGKSDTAASSKKESTGGSSGGDSTTAPAPAAPSSSDKSSS